jgi:hypothetical protein
MEFYLHVHLCVNVLLINPYGSFTFNVFCAVRYLTIICFSPLFFNYSTDVLKYYFCLFFVLYFICILCVCILCIVLCTLLLCFCFPIFVCVYRPLPRGENPITVNKYNISHISYHKPFVVGADV